ncbi:hypothetical protein VNO77_05794 [Canavalia gladiata]|uniref:Uncharacterized protein n=1 Tax=Canavalia gladiata TaxID=3824 RepID=A0AAN9MYZ8_CANGL
MRYLLICLSKTLLKKYPYQICLNLPVAWTFPTLWYLVCSRRMVPIMFGSKCHIFVQKLWKERYRDDRGRDDYYSPERSRSYSRSPSPSGEKDYRRSPRHRQNGRSPNDKKDQIPNRSESPRGNDRSPLRSRSRSYSPR